MWLLVFWRASSLHVGGQVREEGCPPPPADERCALSALTRNAANWRPARSTNLVGGKETK